MLLTLLCLVPVVSPDTTPPPDPPPGDLQEELLSVRGELYSYMREDSRGDTLLLTLLMRDLKDEVKEIRKLVTDSCEETASLRREIQEGKSLVSSKIQEVKSEVSSKIQEVKSEVSSKIQEVKSEVSSKIQEVKSEVSTVKDRLNLARDEVRLLSQHKLTWQNNTYADILYSDFLVDGVYRLTNDDFGMNPIQHTHAPGPNVMAIIDLGSLFKIHTVKLWKRVNPCCPAQFIGLQVYADGVFIGATFDDRRLHNVRVTGEVFAQEILIKQPRGHNLSLLEVQVYGTGPYDPDEI